MRKQLLSILLIGIGLSFIFLYFLNKNTEEYPETIFAKDSKGFDNSFNAFTDEIKNNIEEITKTYSDTNFIKNNIHNEKFFMKLLNENKHLLAVSFIQNKYKLHIYHSEGSLVIGIDSTKDLDIVSWHRYKKNKIISSWEESYNNKITQTDWYKVLKKEKHKIHWIFNTEQRRDVEFNEDNELFYGGYSYGDSSNNNIILLRFSRMQLLSSFGIYRKYDHVNLFVETLNGKRMNLGSGILNTFKNIDSTITKNANYNDSINEQIMQHFNRFNSQSEGVFNFSYNGETYWNSFKRLDKNKGVKYYLLTVPNSEIIVGSQNSNFINYSLIGGVLFIILGILFQFIAKHRFNNILRKKLPSIKELLIDDENRYLEFKSSLRWDYRQEKVNPALEQVIFKTIAAFGNTDGGFLLIGIDDDKNILGLEKDFSTLKKNDADYFEIHLRNLLHTLMGVKYVSNYIRMNFEVTDHKTVCKIQVLKAGEPLFLNVKDKNGKTEEKFYVRSGNSSQQIVSIVDINDYINTKWN